MTSSLEQWPIQRRKKRDFFAIESLEELQTKLDRERDWLLNTPEDEEDRQEIARHSLERLESIEVALANKHLHLGRALDDIETRLDKCDEAVKDTLPSTRARIGTGRPFEPAARPSPPRYPRVQKEEASVPARCHPIHQDHLLHRRRPSQATQ